MRAAWLTAVAALVAIRALVWAQGPQYPITVIETGKGSYTFPEGYQTPWDKIEIRVTEKMSPNLVVLHGSQGLDPAHPDASGGRAMVLFGSDGVLLVDKPAGITSHDVVDRIRRHFGFRKVGHCGTLDPAATGLLIIVLERATKLQANLMSEDKTYEGVMQLGTTTDSQDSDGEVLAEKPVPPLTEADIESVLAKFRGDLQQVPPMVSAITVSRGSSININPVLWYMVKEE